MGTSEDRRPIRLGRPVGLRMSLQTALLLEHRIRICRASGLQSQDNSHKFNFKLELRNLDLYTFIYMNNNITLITHENTTSPHMRRTLAIPVGLSLLDVVQTPGIVHSTEVEGYPGSFGRRLGTAMGMFRGS